MNLMEPMRQRERYIEELRAENRRLRVLLGEVRWCIAGAMWKAAEDVIKAALADEQPADSDVGFVWPENEVRRVKAKLGETRVRPPFVIADDDEQPAESEGKK